MRSFRSYRKAKANFVMAAIILAIAAPTFVFHFTPTSASWINLVERWFAALTQKQIRRGSFRSTR